MCLYKKRKTPYCPEKETERPLFFSAESGSPSIGTLYLFIHLTLAAYIIALGEFLREELHCVSSSRCQAVQTSASHVAVVSNEHPPQSHSTAVQHDSRMHARTPQPILSLFLSQCFLNQPKDEESVASKINPFTNAIPAVLQQYEYFIMHHNGSPR